MSVGPASGSGLFVISTAPSGSRRLAVVDDPGTTWDRSSASTVDHGHGRLQPRFSFDHRHVHRPRRTMTVWALNSGSSDWVKGQVMQVAIESARRDEAPLQRWGRAGRAEPSCDAVREAISASHDGEMPTLRAKESETHLARCPECRRFQLRVSTLPRQVGLR